MKKILLLMAIAIIGFTNCTTIDSGSIGVKFYKWSSDETEKGGVKGTCKGFVFYNPFSQDIYEYPTFVQRCSYEPFQVNAKDAAIFEMTPTLAYRLNPDMIEQIFVKYRKPINEIEDGYIRTCIYEAYRTCGNVYTSDYLMSNRGEFESEVRQRLEKSLMEEGFIVEEFTTQITPPASLVAAINAKNEAVQSSLKAENLVKAAEANAKIVVAKAEGEAKALKIKGDGEAYYNRVVSASLNELLVRQNAIERWDGVMPKFSGNGAVPFIEVK